MAEYELRLSVNFKNEADADMLLGYAKELVKQAINTEQDVQKDIRCHTQTFAGKQSDEELGHIEVRVYKPLEL